jgi:ATP-dependent helicase HrpB
MLHGAEIHDLINFPWFEAPSALAIEAAESLLHTLGAINKRGEITNIGRRMLAFPVHPRLARMIVESENMNVAEDVILLSALMSERDIRFRSRADFSQQNATAKNSRPGSSDLIELLDCYREAESAGFSEDRLRSLELDYRAVQAVRRASRQLERIQKRKRTKDVSARAQNDEALHISVLAAFPDRVAKRRKPGSQELLLSGGGSAFLSDTSAAHSPIFLVAVDVEERKNKVSADMPGTIVRLTSAVEIEWIAGLFPDAVTESIALIWNDRAERVDEAKRVNYGQIALEETIAPAPPSDEASRMLAAEVLRKGIENIWDLSFLSDIKERIAIAASHFPEEDFPSFENERSRALIESMCTGKRSMTEVASMSPIDAFLSGLSYKQRVLLERELPEKIRLKAGRTVTVHYEPGKPPWIQSRLQDFFGMKQTPKICAGRVPLTVHLLAPNNRAVQVTQDLAGFWERHYPSIRKELQRRYPKHKWPSPEEIK